VALSEAVSAAGMTVGLGVHLASLTGLLKRGNVCPRYKALSERVRMRFRSARRAIGAAVAGCALVIPASAPAVDPPILLGANAIQYSGGTPPDCFGPSILFDYAVRDTRVRVRQQLAAMAAAGLETLRVFFVYDHDTNENPYFIPAKTGRLEEPFRTNLVNYLSDIRAAGFSRVTLAFDPRPSADPTGRFGR
jgi:hypothetical protein